MSGEQEIYVMMKLDKHPKMAVCLGKLSAFLGENSMGVSCGTQPVLPTPTKEGAPAAPLCSHRVGNRLSLSEAIQILEHDAQQYLNSFLLFLQCKGVVFSI